MVITIAIIITMINNNNTNNNNDNNYIIRPTNEKPSIWRKESSLTRITNTN